MGKRKKNRQERRLAEKQEIITRPSPKSAPAKKKVNHNRWCAERIFKLFRALLVIVLIECTLIYLFQHADYNNYKATPDNTHTVKVNNPVITVERISHRYPYTVCIEIDGIEYGLDWRRYYTSAIGMGPNAFAEKLRLEKELEVVVKNDSYNFVSVRGKSTVYLEVDIYNAWQKMNGTLGLIAFIPSQIAFALVSGYYIYATYFKLDEWKDVRWIRLPRSFY